MKSDPAPAIESAEVVLPCAELDETLAFFRERLGFELESIHPADDPAVAVVRGYGLRLRLARGAVGDPGVLRLSCAEPAALGRGASHLVAPNGTRIELARARAEPELPAAEPSLVITRAGEREWKPGRAGMLYRDLVPDRQGGRFVASHIRVPDGGPVADYVHYHRVRFQTIFCHRGWVRVVYEDQGEPFVLNEGDCVLQPPEIRHRVLECSPGLEVVEVASPAEHETRTDPGLALPTPETSPERDFDGQRFVRHVAAQGRWTPWRFPGFEACETGIAEATRGLAGVRVIRPTEATATPISSHEGELLFAFVRRGALTLESGAGRQDLTAGASFVLPAGERHRIVDCARELELLEVTLPASP